MMVGFISSRETIEVPVAVDIERTGDSFHAHAIPQDIEIREGDIVLNHDVPSDIAFGTLLTMECRGTVMRAGLLERLWTRMTSLFELTELYEVGFQPKEDS